jgi:hypothetical protein
VVAALVAALENVRDALELDTAAGEDVRDCAKEDTCTMMALYPGVADAQLAALSVLRRLRTFDAIFGSDAVEAVVTALRLHPSATAVQTAGLGLLTRLDARDQQLAGGLGAVEAAVEALRAHAYDAHVCQAALVVLRWATTTAAGRVRACAAGALEELVHVLREVGTRRSDVELHAACCALERIADSRASAARAGACGAVEALVAYIQRHDLPCDQVPAAMALSRLIQHSADNVVRAQRAGAVQVLRAAQQEAVECAGDKEGASIGKVAALLERSLAAAAASAEAALAELLNEEAQRVAAKSAAASAKKKKKKAGRSADKGSSGGGGGGEHASAGPAAGDAQSDDEAATDAEAAAPPQAAQLGPQQAPPLPPPAADGASGSGAGAGSAAAGITAPRVPHPPPAAPPPAASRAPRPYRPPMGCAPLAPQPCAVAALQPQQPQQPPPPTDAARLAALSLLPAYLGGLAQPLPAPAAAAAPPPEAPLSRALKECCVCLYDVAVEELWLLLPCGHRCVCEPCAAQLMQPPPEARKCPKCRTQLSSTMRVFED